MITRLPVFATRSTSSGDAAKAHISGRVFNPATQEFVRNAVVGETGADVTLAGVAGYLEALKAVKWVAY